MGTLQLTYFERKMLLIFLASILPTLLNGVCICDTRWVICSRHSNAENADILECANISNVLWRGPNCPPNMATKAFSCHFSNASLLCPNTCLRGIMTRLSSFLQNCMHILSFSIVKPSLIIPTEETTIQNPFSRLPHL